MEKNVENCQLGLNRFICGDALQILKTFPKESIDCIVTSPPYWSLRNYGVDGQLGLEKDFNEYISKLCDVFDEIKRIIRKTGTAWVNLGDSYSGSSNNRTDKKLYKSGFDYKKNQLHSIKTFLPKKCLCQIPSRFAIEMTSRGWILRNEIIWQKPNAMPCSAIDRFGVDFEKIFFFTKNKKAYHERQFTELKETSRKRALGNIFSKKTDKGIHGGMTLESQREAFRKMLSHDCKGAGMRCVWTIPTKGFSGSHFAVFPEKLPEICIKAGCPEDGIVLDPFSGAGTTCLVAKKLGRNYIGIEINKDYIEMAEKRIHNMAGLI
jgi:site-specific DNA-methyltransferase (adenine-specific)